MKIVGTLAIIFCIILTLIFLIRVVLLFLINQAYKRYLKLKKISKKILPRNQKKYEKEEEELLRKLEIPRAHSALKAEIKSKIGQDQSGTYELIPSKEQEESKRQMNQTEIVDFVKPIGFWTAMILGQKLTYLIQSAHILNKRGDKGFWASMVEAKERAAGRQHARGR
ncbi:MAG: hypothetical protein A2887_05760 [Alphaproteobacteria bacterium RIFCSPLOWO2_01_FULL_40_26]|nr:MAG: hypothetical protein A3D15_02020 [Alphaproteobacteria bacterium RIFCSPHIGHO2_02_FULL_40_34]OFW86856.1 MAG: hypothetical protein A2794_04495 [Alphaproteobacteria bacterium RIFCSPHIGHO2_01_FULL_40_8]OFW94234.1 MAG: hypothetical protein A2887_05760 [Alphaproteobacteria bacterium RIFCSPLOWO2_01_FULL_40_26]OFX09803.1 MAG: hypothetical protein A3H30_00520 [Alphaproteobacteria bacterium RIFCSPLOWO2_02_FULL_40_19]OFX12256.1 MAG: hypothetical protein A3G22_06910 [Alphaproteobacteria bacterium RI